MAGSHASEHLPDVLDMISASQTASRTLTAGAPLVLEETRARPHLLSVRVDDKGGACPQGVAQMCAPDVRKIGADGVVQHARQQLHLQAMRGAAAPCTAQAGIRFDTWNRESAHGDSSCVKPR